jgi:glycosyltransferase involved in cell wall biosynthesis
VAVRFSVIVPAYNAATTIAAALDSLSSQTFPDWEAVIVDDGSTDATASIAGGFAERDRRFRVVTRENGGEAAARNTGLCDASHEWILFLDADDWIAPHHLERMSAALVSDPTLDAVHCRSARVAADGSMVVERYQAPAGDLFPTLARRAAFPIHACVVRKTRVDEVGQFDTSLKTSPDWDLWQRVARTGARFGVVDDVLAFYRMSPHSASLDACQLLRDGIRVLRQGHGPDPRVKNADPRHQDGCPAEGVGTQQYYLLSWCAALLLGAQRDAAPLFELLDSTPFPELYPEAVAQCLFEGAPLATCQSEQAWQSLWPVLDDRISSFLTELEAASGAPDLRGRTRTALQRMILNSSTMWKLWLQEFERLASGWQDELRAQRDASRESHNRLLEEHQRLASGHEELQRLLASSATAWNASLQQLEQTASGWRDELQAHKDAHRRLLDEHRRLTEAHVVLQESNQAAAAALEAERAERRRLELQCRHLEETVGSAEREMRRLEGEQQQLAATLRESQAARERLETALAERRQATEARAAELAQKHQQEMAALRSSHEWRVGDALWNRYGLARWAPRVARLLRSAKDRRNRTGLALSRIGQRTGLLRPRAVVAACWSFPIHSQTFVYQEVQSLAWLNLEPLVFCCETNGRGELPAAFSSLWDKRVVLVPEWTRNQEDLEHFRRTRPERVASLLSILADYLGSNEEGVLRESIVMMGFTFARHVEISGARYLHTYFFYDQSFMALMAAHLLEIPRGITAYADHMLDDYAFKCVPLHMRLADVVVATSRRIKDELNEKSGHQFDSKIIVKPNGIDTKRFPQVEPAERVRSLATPELIAVNRIEPKKGLIHLVEAVGILGSRGRSVRLHIVGGVDMHTPTSAACHRELTTRIDELGLASRITLHGTKPQAEFVPLLARSHIFVAPYVEVGSGDKDGIPTAVLEGMSTGLPVVATDAGSILEVITHGVEGLAVAQRDPVQLADAVERLLDDRELYASMAAAARQRATTVFDVTVTEQHLHTRIREYLTKASA